MQPLASNNTVLVTGANSGIGLECARALRKKGVGHVVIAGRNPNRLESAARDLGPGVSTLDLDLSSLRSVRTAAQVITRRLADGALPPLFALVCNAGMQVAAGPVRYTTDGFEITFGTNHLGHFLLVNLLLERLTRPGRVVFTSSGTHDPDTLEGRFNKPVFTTAEHLAYPDTPGAPRLSHLQRYSTSKLCNLYCAYELARRLRDEGGGVTSNAFDPGAVPSTGLLRDHGALAKAILAGPLIRWLGVRVETPESAGGALAALVTDPNLAVTTGRYFAGRAERRSSKASYDETAARQLWRESCRLVGLPES